MSESTEMDKFEVGDNVIHKVWGTGVILHKTGFGDKAKVIVNFPEEGEKKLMLKYAKLKKTKDNKPKPPKEDEEEIIEKVEKPFKPKKYVEDDDLLDDDAEIEKDELEDDVLDDELEDDIEDDYEEEEEADDSSEDIF